MHVVSLRGRKRVNPNLASQQGGLSTRYEGSWVLLATGNTVAILESYDEANEKLFSPPSQDRTEDQVPQDYVQSIPDSSSAVQSAPEADVSPEAGVLVLDEQSAVTPEAPRRGRPPASKKGVEDVAEEKGKD